MRGHMEIDGDVGFHVELVRVRVEVEGQVINASFRDVTEDGVASATLVFADHPILIRYLNCKPEDETDLRDDADDEFYDKFIDAVSELDGDIGPWVRLYDSEQERKDT